MKLGTYTTFDCPTKKEGDAYNWLQVQFEGIGGSVRRVINSHDFGGYPSFEIDYPYHLELIDMDDEFDNDEDLEKNQKLVNEKDDWMAKAEVIQEKYNKKFEDYL